MNKNNIVGMLIKVWCSVFSVF